MNLVHNPIARKSSTILLPEDVLSMAYENSKIDYVILKGEENGNH